jgi:hypothetical protein
MSTFKLSVVRSSTIIMNLMPIILMGLSGYSLSKVMVQSTSNSIIINNYHFDDGSGGCLPAYNISKSYGYSDYQCYWLQKTCINLQVDSTSSVTITNNQTGFNPLIYWQLVIPLISLYTVIIIIGLVYMTSFRTNKEMIKFYKLKPAWFLLALVTLVTISFYIYGLFLIESQLDEGSIELIIYSFILWIVSGIQILFNVRYNDNMVIDCSPNELLSSSYYQLTTYTLNEAMRIRCSTTNDVVMDDVE